MNGLITDIETNPPGDNAAGVPGTNPAQSQGAPGVRDADQDQGQAAQSDQALDEDGNPIEPAPELDEWEDEDGKKYQVPKALTPRLMKDADYTRKTQEHAQVVRQEQARIAQAQQQLALQVQAQQQHLQQRAKVAALDMELAKYQGVNWALAGQQDAGAAQQAWLAFQQLKEQRTGVEKELQAMESSYIAQAQAQAQAASRQAQEAVARIVSQWTPEDRDAVNKIGSEVYGVRGEHFKFFAENPGLLPILRDAVRYQQAQARAKSAAKPPAAAPAAEPPRTLQPGTGRAAPRSMDDPGMSMTEWMQRRNQQIKRKR
ncbi:MAG TPA: hypothetical protein PKO45_13065 [Rubrivivax sp.]|nr:hypothetical protein [Rubrivivax sp.]